MERSERILNTPNVLTIFRIFLVPFLVVVLLTRFDEKEWVGLGLFWLAASTDFLDGWIARRRKQVTTLGQLLDPIADKLLTAAAFVSLVQIGLAPAWMVVVVLGREFAVDGLRMIASKEGTVIPASQLGKFKMITQVVAISLLILAPKLEHWRFLGKVALWFVLVLAVGSGVDYFQKFWRTVITPGRALTAPPTTAEQLPESAPPPAASDRDGSDDPRAGT